MELSQESSTTEILRTLGEFNCKHASPANKVTLEHEEQQRVLKLMIHLLESDNSTAYMTTVLEATKIFTRNKHLIESIDDLSRLLEVLLGCAGITKFEDDERSSTRSLPRNSSVVLEAMRCLSNIYLQSPKALDLALENETVPGILYQTTLYKELSVPVSVISFDMKILFLVMAQRPESGKSANVEHQGVVKMIDTMDLVLGRAERRDDKTLSLDMMAVIVEILKATCNMTRQYDEVDVNDPTKVSLMLGLCQRLRSLLTMTIHDQDKRWQIVSNCIYVLTNFQGSWMGCLVEKTDDGAGDGGEDFDGKNMAVPRIMIDFLKISLGKSKGGARENLTPILKVMACFSKSDRTVRRFFRHIVLPPIRDVTKRPEDGTSLRARCCALLTSPDNVVASMVAEFLFVLCKENASRFVKHTGYGNAAGLLARRGMMTGGHSPNPAYSGSDSDSDTEEYQANKSMVNPVMGCIPPAHPSPLAGMTEEQKEFEANKLANLIHQLHDLGAIKPAVIDEDGRPQPVDHVLELVESKNSNWPGKDDNEVSD